MSNDNLTFQALFSYHNFSFFTLVIVTFLFRSPSRPFDRVRVVGKEQPVQLYNILGFKNELSPVELEMTDVFKGAIDAYLKRDFKNAEQIFMEANKVMPDETSIMFAERCREYMAMDLPDDWDGVYQMTTKGHD